MEYGRDRAERVRRRHRHRLETQTRLPWGDRQASAGSDADRIADDKDNGLALLRVYGPRKASPLALTRDAPRTGELTLVGIPDPKEQDGSRKLTEIKARLADGSAIELRQPVPMAGFSGAAALDAQSPGRAGW